MRTAIIFGVTGQDGSFLAEYLLGKEYFVVGVKRRTATNNTWRLANILSHPRFKLVECDITDRSSVDYTIDSTFNDERYNKDDEPLNIVEIYNLAAQSHVGTSFNQPRFTYDVNYGGLLNILESLKRGYSTNYYRVYQASSSEMFGNNVDADGYQRETTPFNPQSPYAISKVAAHQLAGLYRQAYGMHISCGILFNHECLTYDMPIIYKTNNGICDVIDIKSISSISKEYGAIEFDTIKKVGREPFKELYIWDKEGWSRVKYLSAFANVGENYHSIRFINARNGVAKTTDNHVWLNEQQTDIEAKNLNVGDKISICDYPELNNPKAIDGIVTIDAAELFGLLVSEGYKDGNKIQFTNKSKEVRYRFEELWNKVCKTECRYYPSISGFTGEEVGRLECIDTNNILASIDLYDEAKSVFGHKFKKVPRIILNSNRDIMEAFLVGYNTGDGLKQNKCKYKFKNFKTNSPVLAQGLLYLISIVTQQKYNITIEESWKWGKQQFYYSINLLSDRKTKIEKYQTVKLLLEKGLSQREINKQTGISREFIRKVQNGYVPNNTHHLEKINNEIKKIIDLNNYTGTLYDLETESGTFQAGVGQAHIHNSPRRGEEFVTRKITKYVAELKVFKNSLEGWMSDYVRLKLGNLLSSRDWGYAGDYVKAMHLMLQKDTPRDYVIATGKTCTVDEFAHAAFECVGMNMNNWVEVDESLIRPAEVNMLKGDATLARTELGWTPKVTVDELVKIMIDEEPTLKLKEIAKKMSVTVKLHPDQIARLEQLKKINEKQPA